MTKLTKKMGVAIVRGHLAANLRTRMAGRYPSAKNLTAQIRELEKESFVGKTTIQRACNPSDESDITLGSIARLAMALRCEIADLLSAPVD